MAEVVNEFELTDDEINNAVQAFEDQFTVEGITKASGFAQTFGEQLMETHDLANRPVATGGPTWKQTGLTQDRVDGDNHGSGPVPR